MTAPVVRLRGLSKRYGDFTALDRVDLDVAEGEILALLGPNGAGKTTLISIVAGLTRASEGEATVLGRDVVRDYRFTRRAVGLVPAGGQRSIPSSRSRRPCTSRPGTSAFGSPPPG